MHHTFSLLAFLFIGLEEHLVQKFSIVYTKIIQIGWCCFVKVLGEIQRSSGLLQPELHPKRTIHSPLEKPLFGFHQWTGLLQGDWPVPVRGRKSTWRSLTILAAHTIFIPLWKPHTSSSWPQEQLWTDRMRTQDSHKMVKYSSHSLQPFPAGKGPPYTPWRQEFQVAYKPQPFSSSAWKSSQFFTYLQAHPLWP